jgi:ketosteroid isomerase-like protein
MKKLVLLSVILAGFVRIPVFAADPAPGSEQAIKDAVLATNAAMIAAANRLDTDAFFAFIAESDRGPVVQNGVVFRTTAEARDAVKRGLRGIAKLDRRIDNPQVTVLGPDAALLVGNGSMTATGEDGRTMSSTFAVSLVFVRRGGEWKLLHGHYSMPMLTNS